MKKRRQKRKAQTQVVLLVIVCIIATLICACQCFQYLENERLLEEQHQFQHQQEIEIQNQANTLNEQIQSLRKKKITLEDKEHLKMIQTTINDASPDLKRKITKDLSCLMLAQNQIETLLSQKQKYENQPYLFLSNQQMTSLDSTLNVSSKDISVYLKVLDDGSLYLFNPLETYDVYKLANLPFTLYLSSMQKQNEIVLNSIEKEWIDTLWQKKDSTFMPKLVSRYLDNWNHYAEFLKEIGLTHRDLMEVNWDDELYGQMNIIDMGHIMMHLTSLSEGIVSMQGDDGDIYYDFSMMQGKQTYILCLVTDEDETLLKQTKQMIQQLFHN